jgi:hypothetical protein
MLHVYSFVGHAHTVLHVLHKVQGGAVVVRHSNWLINDVTLHAACPSSLPKLIMLLHLKS